ALSADGSAAVMTINGGSLYTTINSGQDWFKQTIRGSATWKSIEISGDGTKVVAVKNGSNQSYIYTSVDSGNTWTEQTSSGFINWSDVAITADGNTIIALPSRGA